MNWRVDVLTILEGRGSSDSNPARRMRRLSSADFPVELTANVSGKGRVETFWEVSDAFRSFARAAAGKVSSFDTGEKILSFAADCGVNDFFRQWSAGEQAEIQKGGKIPDLHRWCDVAAADDMMTQAALQSFAVDQGELDERIARSHRWLKPGNDGVLNLAENPFRAGLTEERAAEPCAVVIFGATGDLTRRKLIPALFSLYLQGLSPARFAIIGFARRPWSDDHFREQMRSAVLGILRVRLEPGRVGDVRAPALLCSVIVRRFRRVRTAQGTARGVLPYERRAPQRDLLPRHTPVRVCRRHRSSRRVGPRTQTADGDASSSRNRSVPIAPQRVS